MSCMFKSYFNIVVPLCKKATTLNFVATDVSLECTKSVHSWCLSLRDPFDSVPKFCT